MEKICNTVDIPNKLDLNTIFKSEQVRKQKEKEIKKGKE